MGFWKEVKKEWTWERMKWSWPDFVAVFPAAFIASEYSRPFWKYMLVWIITFCITKFIIITIINLIKKS